MIRSNFLLMLLVCIICSFCGKDFVTLGRHSWRCKQRVNHAEQDYSNDNTGNQKPVMNSPNVIISSQTVIKCCCGKTCKGARGLKMHQRSCRVINGLDSEMHTHLEEQSTSNFDTENTLNINEITRNCTPTVDEANIPVLKKGVKLPKNNFEWSTANDYFKFALQSNQPITSQDLDSNIKVLNNIVYDYFAEHFGYTKSLSDNSLVNKYKDYTVKDLKKTLKDLKSINKEPDEIRYVSHILRKKLRPDNSKSYSSTSSQNNSHSNSEPLNHDKYIGKNFWGYVKNVMNTKETVLPSFNMTQCLSYFTKTLAAIYPTKLFTIPSWIPALSDPEVQFDLDPPSYQQITNIIRRMKASGSPCPLDQLSIICFKRCPFLRSYLTDLIRAVWLSGTIPTEWKKACTILIHKKGDTNTPANFRPITLESIPLKVFTSCLRNSMYSFLTANNFIEHNIQKGFTPNLSGNLEHTAQMANIINKARIKQRSLVITLLDLKNAFGEVHHNLITSVLDYHHIPEHVKLIVKNLYTDFKTSVITSEFCTPFISVGRGVLQGDCLSPLLFNMCFNTFVQHIKAEKYRQFGFSFQFLNPIHWFQFADDAAVVTSQESENQHLLNRFSIWCQWSNMIIRVDKCSSFGIKKVRTKSVQYLPNVLINNQRIPIIHIGGNFQYLGRYFNFDMSEDQHKSELTGLIKELMSDIDSKPLHPKNKILLYSRYVLPKISWHLTVSSLSKTWVTETIDSLVNSYIRKWLQIPISGTLSSIFLTRNKFGLNICPPSIKFIQCQTVLRKALKTSPNQDINELWKSTSNNKNIQYDVFNSTKQVLKDFRSGQEDKLQNHLTCQGSFFANVTKFALSKLTKIWCASQSKLPTNIFNFTVRYINNSLPTRQNLARWGITPSSDCSYCLAPETLLHVVAGCQSYLERFTWRHDSILNFIATNLQTIRNSSLYVDLAGYKSPSIITGETYRPDLLLSVSNECLYIVELTVGYESNLYNNVKRKQSKYSELIREQNEKFKSVKFVNLSISSLGVFANECSTFIEMLHDLGIEYNHEKYIIRRMTTIAIRTTYYIFCCRNKEWSSPELLTF